MDLEAVAYHEAGHALIALVLGLPVGETRIDVSDAGLPFGHSLAKHRFGPGMSGTSAAGQIASILAGPVAERVLAGEPPLEDAKEAWRFIHDACQEPARRWGTDCWQAIQLAQMPGDGRAWEYLVAAWLTTEQYLRAHRAGLDALAAALLRRRRLDGDEARAIWDQARRRGPS